MVAISVAWWMALTLPVETPAPVEGARPVSLQVTALFEARCAKCHDADRGGTKGDFGHILDLKRLLEEEDVVVRGDPDGSLLYTLGVEGEMPPKPPALSREDLDLVRAWILNPEASGPVAPDRSETRSTPTRFLDWIGRFHPAVVHFPVALLVAAALAECLQMARRRDREHPASRFCLGLGALTGVGAALLGWAYADPVAHDQWLDALHRWLGTAVAVLSVAIAFGFLRRPEGGGARRLRRYRGALMFSALLVGAVGFLGGALHYGLDHYAW